MRLQKFLSDVGFCSRRQAEEFIRAGKIIVNGKKATLGDKVSGKEVISVDGRKLQVKAPPRKKVVVFFKPAGVECTLSPVYGVKTLLDFDLGPDRVFPIGRLDRDAQGLLLLTNDGELGNRLAHPSVEREEEYLVVVKENLTSEMIAQFAQGILLGNTRVVPHRVERLEDNVLRCILHEGRNKQIRKMCDAVGLEILALQRIRVGAIELGELKPGQRRVLTDTEYKALQQGGVVRRVRRRIVPGRRK